MKIDHFLPLPKIYDRIFVLFGEKFSVYFQDQKHIILYDQELKIIKFIKEKQFFD
jgi:hypothetical protein